MLGVNDILLLAASTTLVRFLNCHKPDLSCPKTYHRLKTHTHYIQAQTVFALGLECSEVLERMWLTVEGDISADRGVSTVQGGDRGVSTQWTLLTREVIEVCPAVNYCRHLSTLLRPPFSKHLALNAKKI